MGKAVLSLALSLALFASFAPVAAAVGGACAPVLGACLEASADDGVAACERARSSSSCFLFVGAAGEHTLEAREGAETNHLVADAGAEGATLSYARTRSQLMNEQIAAGAGPAGAHARHRSNWVAVDATGPSASSFLCFVANVDGNLVGVECGDWVNGDVTPVAAVDPMGELEEILSDPLVRCVLSRTCIL